jgi:hypothetical protein
MPYAPSVRGAMICHLIQQADALHTEGMNKIKYYIPELESDDSESCGATWACT